MDGPSGCVIEIAADVRRMPGGRVDDGRLSDEVFSCLKVFRGCHDLFTKFTVLLHHGGCLDDTMYTRLGIQVRECIPGEKEKQSGVLG